MMTDEAVGALDIFLDNAVMGRLTEVGGHHGKGTGKRCARRYGSTSKRSRYVKSFRPGRYGEGRGTAHRGGAGSNRRISEETRPPVTNR